MKNQLNRRTIGALALAAAMVSTAFADAPETLGLWTFNGTSGTYACGNKEEIVFPNHVSRADSLKLQLAWADNATATTEAPLYTNDVQCAYLFDGAACTNLLAECGTSAIFRHDNWRNVTAAGDGSWNKANSYLTLQEAGALIKDRDWTLEMIAHFGFRNGWATIVSLGTNTGNRASFTLRTNGKGMSNSFATAAETTQPNINYTYCKYDSFTQAGTAYNVFVADDRWHHIAVKWSESEKTLRLYVDYALIQSGTFNYWSTKGVNLQLDDHAQFVLFGKTGVNSNLPTIQAVRLTRGDLPVENFLFTSKFRDRPDTVAHWRFDGEPGQTVQILPESIMPNRTDLQLWKHMESDQTMAFVAPLQPFVKGEDGVVTNKSAVGWSGNSVRKVGYTSNSSYYYDETRTFFNIIRDNPAMTVEGTGDSFTHEMFVFCRTNNLYYITNSTPSSAKTLFFGEGGGTGGFTSYGSSVNWIVSQEQAGTAEGLAKIKFEYTYQDDALANGGTRASSTTYVTTNEWHHLALTYNAPARRVNFYVDYQSVYENTLNAGYHMTRGKGIVGAGDMAYGYHHGFEGAIDDWRISRRALSPAEFLRGRANNIASTVFYVR